MARTKEFDPGEVLDRAMHVFWQKGYDATSLGDLLAAMNLSKSSLYETFGSKQELLLDALRHYRETWMAGLLAPLERPNAGRAEIEEFFRRLVEHAASPAGQAGCLVNNCTIEVAPRDSVVRKRVRAIRGGLENAILGALVRAQRVGTISRKEPARALARFLANTVSGINVLAKARPGKEALEDVARVALRALD